MATWDWDWGDNNGHHPARRGLVQGREATRTSDRRDVVRGANFGSTSAR